MREWNPEDWEPALGIVTGIAEREEVGNRKWADCPGLGEVSSAVSL